MHFVLRYWTTRYQAGTEVYLSDHLQWRDAPSIPLPLICLVHWFADIGQRRGPSLSWLVLKVIPCIVHHLFYWSNPTCYSCGMELVQSSFRTIELQVPMCQLSHCIRVFSELRDLNKVVCRRWSVEIMFHQVWLKGRNLIFSLKS